MAIQTSEADVASLPLPPAAPGLPLIGNTFQLADDVLAFVRKQYQQLGPVFRVRALNREYTVMAGPEANLFFAQRGTEYLRSNEFWGGQDAEYGATRSLISMDGPDHIRYRKVQGPSFSRANANDHYPELVAIAQRECKQWTARIRGVYAMQRIITEQLAMVTTGISSREYLDDLIIFLRTLLLVRVTRQRPAALLYTPSFRRTKARIMAFGRQVIDSHRHQTDPSHRPDLIDDILALAAEDPAFLPESDLLIAALGPFIAGLDTAANTCAFILYALLKDPELLGRATAEADALFAGGVPTPQELRSADVLHRVVLETLRRYPIAPAVQRSVARPFAFAGHRIPAGTNVLIAITLPHFLPEYYPEPYRFDIDRYLPERKEHKQHSGTFAPFGLGSHTCLGAGLAEVQMMLTVATILHTVRLTMDPADYTLRIDPAPTQKPDRNFQIRVVQQRHPLYAAGR